MKRTSAAAEKFRQPVLFTSFALLDRRSDTPRRGRGKLDESSRQIINPSRGPGMLGSVWGWVGWPHGWPLRRCRSHLVNVGEGQALQRRGGVKGAAWRSRPGSALPSTGLALGPAGEGYVRPTP